MTEESSNHAGTTGTVNGARQLLARQVSVAPMMDWTDRHCRFFLRGFSPRVLLYTEMITAEALLRGNAARLLQYTPEEQPLALQLGGSEPARLAAAARLGGGAGYCEINLNCGCPRDPVHARAFGACLMAAPPPMAGCAPPGRSPRPCPGVPVRCSAVRLTTGPTSSASCMCSCTQTAGDARPRRRYSSGWRSTRGASWRAESRWRPLHATCLASIQGGRGLGRFASGSHWVCASSVRAPRCCERSPDDMV